MAGDLHPADAPPPGSPHRLRRAPHKAAYDRTTIDAILDATPFCHLGYVHQGRPVVVPTLFARLEDHVVVHASTGSRLGLGAHTPWPVCLTVTLIDALVMARSGFHHSVNHRSVVVHGDAVLLTDPAERLAALKAVTDHVAPGRWDELRAPTVRELEATAVARIPLTEASAKIRTGPPVDDAGDLDADVWAGVVPVEHRHGAPVPAPDLRSGVPISPSVARLTGNAG